MAFEQVGEGAGHRRSTTYLGGAIPGEMGMAGVQKPKRIVVDDGIEVVYNSRFLPTVQFRGDIAVEIAELRRKRARHAHVAITAIRRQVEWLDNDKTRGAARLLWEVVRVAIVDASGSHVGDFLGDPRIGQNPSHKCVSAILFWKINWTDYTDILGLDREFVRKVIDSTIREEWWDGVKGYSRVADSVRALSGDDEVAEEDAIGDSGDEGTNAIGKGIGGE